MALLLLCRQRASWSPPCYRKNKAAGNCTELCTTKHSGRSCPNICLISIYVKTNLDEKIRTYVVINNQSNCSLAKQLTIDSYAISYTLKHALVNLSSRIAQNPQASLGNWMRRYPKQQEKNSYASGWQSTPSSQSNCQQGLWTGCRSDILQLLGRNVSSFTRYKNRKMVKVPPLGTADGWSKTKFAHMALTNLLMYHRTWQIFLDNEPNWATNKSTQ